MFLAGAAYGFTRLVRRLVQLKFPELALSSNFQFGSFLTLFALVTLTFGVTFGLKDNMHIVYENYRTVINASTIVTSETLKVLNLNLFKASGLESEPGTPLDINSEVFSRVNYIDGIDYQKASK
jgi:hypothetical protein